MPKSIRLTTRERLHALDYIRTRRDQFLAEIRDKTDRERYACLDTMVELLQDDAADAMAEALAGHADEVYDRMRDEQREKGGAA